MERISKHVSYKEGVRSNTATRLSLDNTPRFLSAIKHGYSYR